MTIKLEHGHMGVESQYTPLTKDEVRQLALDNMAGSVFGSWQMSQNDLQHIWCVFLPMIAMNDLHIKALERDEVMHVYGHLSDAINRSINGMPIFHSFKVINADDLKRVNKMQQLIQALEEPE